MCACMCVYSVCVCEYRSHSLAMATDSIVNMRDKVVCVDNNTLLLHLYRWFLKVSQVGRGLSRFLAKSLHPGIRQTERVNHHLP